MILERNTLLQIRIAVLVGISFSGVTIFLVLQGSNLLILAVLITISCLYLLPGLFMLQYWWCIVPGVGERVRIKTNKWVALEWLRSHVKDWVIIESCGSDPPYTECHFRYKKDAFLYKLASSE